MHSDIVLENVLLKDSLVILQPWTRSSGGGMAEELGSWDGWLCLGGPVSVKVLAQPLVLLDFELLNASAPICECLCMDWDPRV